MTLRDQGGVEPRIVVARVVLMRDVRDPGLWIFAIDSGWGPEQGLGPWVGGAEGHSLEQVAQQFARSHQHEWEEYLRRVGYSVGP